MNVRVPIIVALAIVVAAANGFGQQPSAMSDVVLVVNGQPVYFWEVGLVLPQVQAELASRGEAGEGDEMAEAAIRQVVQTRLLAQEATRRGLTANAGRVQQTMAKIATDAGGPEELATSLEMAGVDLEKLRSMIAEADLVQVFVESAIQPSVEVSDDDVAEFYAANPSLFQRPEEVRARHILFKVAPDATLEGKTAARARTVAARQRVIAGEDFAEVAREVSQCPSAAQGGDLGFFGRQQVEGSFADAVFSLEPGEVSQIVETTFGYHVVKVEERRPPSVQNLEQVRTPLTRMLRDREAAAAVDRELVRLAEAATIVEPEAEAPAPTPAE